MLVNYQGIREAILRRAEFKGNSCRAVKTTEGYEIYSYVTLIYKENRKFTSNLVNFSTKDFNVNYYSVTTSKLQGIIAGIIYGQTLKELRKDKQKEEKVIQYLKDNNLEAEYCSPNIVNLYANKIGIELTPSQVVSISDNYK